jgi:hypothetical protein
VLQVVVAGDGPLRPPRRQLLCNQRRQLCDEVSPLLLRVLCFRLRPARAAVAVAVHAAGAVALAAPAPAFPRIRVLALLLAPAAAAAAAATRARLAAATAVGRLARRSFLCRSAVARPAARRRPLLRASHTLYCHRWRRREDEQRRVHVHAPTGVRCHQQGSRLEHTRVDVLRVCSLFIVCRHRGGVAAPWSAA